MKKAPARLVAAAAALAALAVAASPRDSRAVERYVKVGRTYRWSFEADTLGMRPANTVAFGGTWSVVADSADTSAAARRFLRQSEGDDGIVFHYLSFTKPMMDDFEASVRFRTLSGELDPSVGLIFQMDKKATSGYLVRVNTVSGELKLHYLLSGRRRDVRYSKIDPMEHGTWHTLAVSRKGAVLRVRIDGTERMMVREERYLKGTIGLWTEDDTVAEFADLTVTLR